MTSRRVAALAAAFLLAGCTTTGSSRADNEDVVATSAPAPASSAPTSDTSDTSDSGTSVDPATVTPTSTVVVGGDALASLATLRVGDRQPAGLPPYERDAFGSSWSDVDGNGCNQRDDVLLRDALPDTAQVQQQGRCDHDVLAGSWLDPYTGKTLTFTDLKDLSQAQAIQIDHVVPLAEAWVSGAADWTDERRKQFANDLPGLLAVDGPANASKGAGDPAAWRPRKDYQCAYAERWIVVKVTWDLAVDDSETRALAELLAYC